MHEFNLRVSAAKNVQISSENSVKLTDTKSSIQRKSALIWAEHCSECAMPACFSYCEYYAPRPDLKCRRFKNGIEPVSTPNGKRHPEAMSVFFKKWGKLEAKGTAKFISTGKLKVINIINTHCETILRRAPLPYFMKLFAVKAFQKTLLCLSESGTTIEKNNDKIKFAIETINNETQSLALSLTIREVEAPTRFYQKRINVPTGHNITYIDINEINGVSLKQPCLYQIETSQNKINPNIIFGTLDFVQLKKPANTQNPTTTESNKAQKVKAVIWDLDNTLWDGTLIEDGIDKIKLRPHMVHTIMKLDEMGILNAVASKNNHDDAMAAIKRFGLEEYFLYPQISWNPKSAAIQTIQKSLNIGMDTIIFIDDQVFERTEVSASIPEIRTFSDKEVMTLLERPEFQIPVTEDSKNRRKMYQENIVREQEMETSGANYEDFLRSCNIELSFQSLDEDTINRVHELSQRTNQMNFSGNRYTKSQLNDIMNDNEKKTFVISCKDRFGEYGIVGFAIIDDPNACLIDLMFSCRIQAKQVEHTFIKHALAYYADKKKVTFHAHYRPTQKNAQSGKVFDDVGFTTTAEQDGLKELSYDLTKLKKDTPIMTVIDKTLSK